MRAVIVISVLGWVTAWGATDIPVEVSDSSSKVLTSSAAADASSHESSRQLRKLADAFLAWRLEREPLLRLARGLPIEDLPHYDLQSAEENSRFASELLPRLHDIDARKLPDDLKPLREILEQELESRSHASRYYWLGFLVTPYSGGDIHVDVQRLLHSQQIDSPGAAQRYLTLLRAYARVLDEIHDKTVEQQRRGILVPRPAIPGCRSLIEGLRQSLGSSLALTPDRLHLLNARSADRLRRDADRLIEREILPRIDRIAAVLDDKYIAAAPESVGVSQYPGGSEYYRALARRFTGDGREPRDIHESGLRWVAEINAQLASIREQIGYSGTRAAFHEMLKSDPRFFASSPDDVAARYEAFLRKIEPHLPKYFNELPQAPYEVMRLDERDEPGMTYGMYQSPTATDPRGYYRFNGSDLERRTQIGAQHLIYHELMPGHHLQVARHREMTEVHPLQTLSESAAFTEGWAEYAASLAVEMGIYEPYDLYGHYLMQLFLAVRIVVDTGMNELGWTLARARQYMAEQLLEGPRQIESESLRYSTDLPGQALAYGSGYLQFRALRSRAERALGSRFDVRDFHDVMLAQGEVPLPVLDDQLDAWVLRTVNGQAARHISAVNVASIVVPGRPASVWNLLLERSAWMENVVSAEPTRGQPGTTGSRMLYRMRDPNGGAAEVRAEETLLAIPGKRLVLRAYSPEADQTSATADFRLEPAPGGHTRVEMSAYWSEDAPELMALDELEKLEQQYREATQKVLEGYLGRLRQSAMERR